MFFSVMSNTYYKFFKIKFKLDMLKHFATNLKLHSTDLEKSQNYILKIKVNNGNSLH